MGFIAKAARSLSFLGDQAKSMIQVLPTWSGESVAQWNYRTLSTDGYRRNAVVSICVDKVATNGSEPPILLYAEKGGVDEPLPEHPLSVLLNQPNPLCSRYEFFEMLLTIYQIAGNVFLFKERNRGGQVIALWLLRPDRMIIKPDPEKVVAGYQYNVDGIVQNLNKDDVIHWKRFDPLNDHWGMPKLAAISQEVDAYNAMSRFMRSFFTNAGVPYGLLKVKGNASPPQAEKLRNRWMSMFNGPSSWHTVAVLDDDASYEQIGAGLGSRDLAMVDLRDITEAVICATFGVPAQIAGVNVGLKNMIYNTYAEARTALWGDTLVPLLERLCSNLELHLLPDFEQAKNASTVFHIRADLSGVSALQEDADAVANRSRSNLMAGGIMLDEWRGENGYDPLPNKKGEVYFIPSSVTVVPAAEVGDEVEVIQAPAGTPTKPKEEGEKSLPFGKLVNTKRRRTVALSRRILALRKKREPDVERKLQGALSSLSDVVVARYDRSKSLKAEPGDLVQDADVDIIMRVLIPEIVAMGGETVELISQMLGDVDYSLRITGMNRYLSEHALERATRVLDTQRGAIRNVLLIAEERGYGQYQIVNGVPADGFRGLRDVAMEAYRGQANAIARTEMGFAANNASVIAYDAAGVEKVKVYDGIDFDEPCVSANGKEWDTRRAMSEALQHPNCRRSFSPIIDDNGRMNDPITPEEQSAAESYTTNDHREINSALRSGEEMSARLQRITGLLDSYIYPSHL